MGDFEPEIEIEPEKAGFKRDNEFEIGDTIKPEKRERCSYLDVCSRFGHVFVGRQYGFDVYTFASLESGQPDPVPLVSVNISSELRWITCSCDGLTLLVATSDKGASGITFYDVRSLVKGEKGHFARQTPSPSPGNRDVISVAWNPSQPEFVTIIFESGAVEVLKVTDKIDVVATETNDFGACCVAWSPKGKQMVIGKVNGQMAQYVHTPSIVQKKLIPSNPSLSEPAKVSDIAWLSTYVFAVAYEPIGANGKCPANLYTLHLPEKGETRDPIWRSFDDPTYAGDILRRNQVYMPYIVQWNTLAVLSSNSGDGALMGKIGSAPHQIFNLADHLRLELPLDDGGADPPCVLGAAWGFNSSRSFKIGEKMVSQCPSLLLLSDSGVLIKYELFNEMEKASMYQALDRLSGMARPALQSEESKPKPRISAPLDRTKSVLATPTIPNAKAPMAESTPAPKLSIDSTKSFPSTSFGTASFTPPTPAAQSTFIKPKPTIVQAQPKKTSTASNSSLKALIADFDRDLASYKAENSKVSLAGLDDSAKRNEQAKIKKFDAFEQEATDLLTSHRDELNELKLRSLESWAQAEEINHRKNANFVQRMEIRDTKLDPVLARQLETINSYKSYLTASLADLERILGEKRQNAKKKQVDIRGIYELLSNNQKVLRYQESTVDVLNSKLNKLRLSKSSSLTTSPARSKKDDELPLTPSFMKKPIRPDTASRLKKMFASRGSIPVVQSPKKVATINKKPDFLLQAQEEAEQEAEPVLETTVIKTPAIAPPKQMFSTPKPTAQPTMPAIPKFSNEMMNNVPQVVTFGSTDMPKDKLSSALAPRQFAPLSHVNKPTTDAVQTVLNTVHKISEKEPEESAGFTFNKGPKEPEIKKDEKPKPLFGGPVTSTPLFGLKKTESVFAPKPDKPKEEKPSLFVAKTEESKVNTPSGFNLGTKTDIKPKPSLVPKEAPKITETKQEEKSKEPEKKEDKPKPGLFSSSTSTSDGGFNFGAPSDKPRPNVFGSIKSDDKVANPFAAKSAPTTSAPVVNPFGGGAASAFGSSVQAKPKTAFVFSAEPNSEDEEKTESEITDGEYTTDHEDDEVIIEKVEEPEKPVEGGFGLFGKKDKKTDLPKPSLFGASSDTPKANLFGGETAKSDDKPAEEKSSLFGGVKEAPKTEDKPKVGLFGGATDPVKTEEKPKAGLFGGETKSDLPKPGLFGGVTTSATDSPKSGLFGAKTETPQKGLFGGATADKPLFGGDQTPKPGLFGSAATTSTASPFGSTAKSGGLFGSTTETKEAPKSGGLFGGETKTDAPKSGGLFGSATEQPKEAPKSLFGGATDSSKPGLFGSGAKSTDLPKPGLFGSAPVTDSPKPGLFGSSTQSSEPAKTAGLFGGSGGGFGGLGGKPDPEMAKINPFGGGASNSAPSSQSGLFGGSKPAAFGSGFGSTTQEAPKSSLFGGGNQATSPFGSQSNTQSSGGGFGGSAFGGQAASPFGSATSNPSGGGAFGGSAFGGAKQSPFGSATANQGSGDTGGTFGSSVFGSSPSTGQQSAGSSGFGGFKSPGGGGGFGTVAANNGGPTNSSFSGQAFSGFR